MRVVLDIPPRPEFLRAALRGLTALNREVLRQNQLPPLYASGVRYRAEELGSESWKRADRVFADSYGDCEDLACWRAAELNDAGELGAFADVVPSGAGGRRFHAIVRRGDGSTEDPSLLLRR